MYAIYAYMECLGYIYIHIHIFIPLVVTLNEFKNEIEQH